ncbi:MAG: hypothetical protein WCA29_03505 [Jiangellales bacterium]
MTRLTPLSTRRLVTVLAAVAATTALTGCGTNINAQTQDWYDPTDGAGNTAEESLNGMAIRDVLIVSDGTDATVTGTFVNTSPDVDAVASIEVDGRSATLIGDLEVAPAQAVRLGPPGEARAQVDGANIEPGIVVPVTIIFDTAPAAELDAIVRAAEGDYAESGPESAAAEVDEAESTQELETIEDDEGAE